MTTERPILFSAEMVRALIAGTKTQTRRAMRPEPSSSFVPIAVERYEPTRVNRWGEEEPGPEIFGVYSEDEGYRCPYGEPGDRLWVRETGWERPERTAKMMREGADTWAPYYYDADGISEQDATDLKAWGFKRRPSIFMPRAASRLTLEVARVRVERLQAITHEDAEAEGVTHYRCGHPDCSGPNGEPGLHHGPRGAYMELWESINGRGSWDANPWVWVIEFRPVAE